MGYDMAGQEVRDKKRPGWQQERAGSPEAKLPPAVQKGEAWTNQRPSMAAKCGPVELELGTKYPRKRFFFFFFFFFFF
jgi:hypothetical protein